MTKHTWTNSQGIEVELKVVPPFYEIFIRQQFFAKADMPKPPGYWITEEGADGKEFKQYYSHSDETMTEVVFTDNATNVIRAWRGENGEILRWRDDTTANERRSWTGYKTKLAQAKLELEAKVMTAILSGLTCEAVIATPTDEWLAAYEARYGGKPANPKHDYILEVLCPSETEYFDLMNRINEIRGISEDRVTAYGNIFRPAKKQDTTEPTA